MIFEVNLKLFRHQQVNQESGSSKKLLLFVLRDFDDRTNNEEVIRQIIEADIDSIWGEIYKPEDSQQVKSSDYFDFDFKFLPHKIF